MFVCGIKEEAVKYTVVKSLICIRELKLCETTLYCHNLLSFTVWLSVSLPLYLTVLKEYLAADFQFLSLSGTTPKCDLNQHPAHQI